MQYLRIQFFQDQIGRRPPLFIEFSRPKHQDARAIEPWNSIFPA